MFIFIKLIRHFSSNSFDLSGPFITNFFNPLTFSYSSLPFFHTYSIFLSHLLLNCASISLTLIPHSYLTSSHTSRLFPSKSVWFLSNLIPQVSLLVHYLLLDGKRAVEFNWRHLSYSDDAQRLKELVFCSWKKIDNGEGNHFGRMGWSGDKTVLSRPQYLH